MSRLLYVAVTAACMITGCAGDDGRDGLFDPQGPGASGTVDLAPGIDPSDYAAIVTVLTYPDRDVHSTGVVELPTAFPAQFYTGYGIGFGSTGEYKLQAWLTRDLHDGGPAPDAPFAETTVQIYCDRSCDGALGVTLVLQQRE